MGRAPPGGIVGPPLAIEWWPARFYSQRQASIVAIVDHIAQGYGSAMHAVLALGQVSWHYSVYRDGSIEQHVQDEDAAWACGLDFRQGYDAYKSALSIPWIADCWQRQINPNRITLNIEHEGLSGQPFTPEQTAATVALHRLLCERHSIPRDATHVVGHNRIDAVNRSYDPGPAFPWAEVLA